MVTCRDVPAIADLALDPDGPRRQRLALYLHLATCRNCRTYVRGLSATRRLVGEALRREGDPAAVLDRLGVAGRDGTP
jgi:predicted anti-sigma-YlaC factor YlaD